MTTEELEQLKDRVAIAERINSLLLALREGLEHVNNSRSLILMLADHEASESARILYSDDVNRPIKDMDWTRVCWVRSLPGIAAEIKQAVVEIMQKRIAATEEKLAKI
jgi:hypothetical protein